MDKQLKHHGVKGMKWGARRYQDKNGRLTSAGKQHIKDRKVDKKIESYIKSGKAKVDNLLNYEVGELTTVTTPKGEKFITGLMSGHDFDWQEITNYRDEGLMTTAQLLKQNPNAHRYVDGDPIYETHAKGKIADYDLRMTNPTFGAPGTTQNCAKCSAALELRMRGDWNIQAGRQTYPSSVDSASLWFKGAKRVDYDTEVAEEALKSYGPKTSGTISIQFPNGMGGHAMHWTNDSDGNFEIQDGQNGRRFSSLEEMMNTYGADKSVGVSTFRLDNCEPDWDVLSQDSVIRLEGAGGKVRNKNSGRVVDTW